MDLCLRSLEKKTPTSRMAIFSVPAWQTGQGKIIASASSVARANSACGGWSSGGARRVARREGNFLFKALKSLQKTCFTTIAVPQTLFCLDDLKTRCGFLGMHKGLLSPVATALEQSSLRGRFSYSPRPAHPAKFQRVPRHLCPWSGR